MPKCTYCKQNYEHPKGLTYIMINGTINHLCSSKCKKNMLMKRRKIRWISKTKKTKEDKISTKKVEEKPVFEKEVKKGK